jgi:hypothetical protein
MYFVFFASLFHEHGTSYPPIKKIKISSDVKNKGETYCTYDIQIEVILCKSSFPVENLNNIPLVKMII